MKIFYFLLFCIFSLFPSAAIAHGLYLTSKDGKIFAHFSDHSPAAHAAVCIVDEDGIEILRETLDEKGSWQLPDSFNNIPHMIIVEATGGHRTYITWEEAVQGTSRKFFNNLIIRAALGVVVLCCSGFLIKRFLNPRSKISNPK